MRWTATTLVTASLFGLLLGRSAPAADPAQTADDEQRLKTAKLGVDGPGLLAFFEIRARPEYDQAKIAALVRNMGNDSDKVSSPAIRELISMGIVTVPWLRRALNDPDNTLAAQRAKFCLESIEGPEGAALAAAAARTLAARRLAGASKALLSYLPFADDDILFDEIRDSLAALAVINGKVDEALVAALKDPVPIRRAVAAEALCQAAARSELPAVRYLLRDPKPTVRLRAAVALAGAKEEEAIPVLIESLGKLDETRAHLAEEVLLRVAGATGPSVALGKDEATRKRCRDTWNTWWKSFQNEKLVEFFRKRTLADADQARFAALVRQLGNDSYNRRQDAMKTLVLYRSAAVPALRKAIGDPDLEVSRRAEQCLALIHAAPLAEFSAANARIIGFRKPEAAVPVLLGYLPFADDDTVAEEVRISLAAMAFKDGKPDEALIAALRDRLPARRVAAAEALLKAGVTAEQPMIIGLLKDPDTAVRLQVALALARARHKEAVPVLIGLLDQVPEEQAWKAEELLRRLADAKAPTLTLGEDAASRTKCRQAWMAWWKERGPTIDMARMDRAARLLGYTIIAQYTNNGSGEVYEIGRNGKERWKISGLNYAFDVQVLPRERVLIPEYNSAKVTERDFKGKVYWEMQVYAPICAQRLPNGNTFVASRNQMLEVDRNKKELYKIPRNNYDIMAAQKLRNGQIVMLTSSGQCIRMDTKGKEIKTFSVGNVNYYGCLDVLPNNHILVAEYNSSKVVEYDQNGKSVWHAAVQWPTCVSRLPNGHTLVGSQNNATIVELDRNGKQVWQFKTTGQPWRVRRR